MTEHLLSIVIFMPLAVAVLMLLIHSRHETVFRKIALIVSSVHFVSVTLILLTNGFKEEQFTWFMISGGGENLFSAGYHIKLDGMSIPLFWLSSFIMLISVYTSWKISFQVKGYYTLLMVLHTAVLGSFAAADFLLFYIFFEFMLIPMYFLVGIWGGKRREYAALKFFIYTLAGSLLILIAMILLYVSVSLPGAGSVLVHSFDLQALNGLKGLIPGSILDPVNGNIFWGIPAAQWVLILLLIGFAVKVPLVPLHTWLPDAHVEAPTPVSVILAALLLKTGAYGMVRFACLILPDEFQQIDHLVAGFAVVSIVYGALNAIASKDLKRMIAYSSVSHMGFVILGIAAGTSMSVQGAIFQMVSHGLVSAMLFLIAGALQERSDDRLIGNYSGFFTKMPVYSAFILIGFFAGMGIPGFASFIGEILVLLGSFSSNQVPGWLSIAATLGIILSAVYFAWTIQRMLFGPFHSKVEGNFEDLKKQETLVFTILTLLIIALGIYPAPLLDIISGFSENWAASFSHNPNH